MKGFVPCDLLIGQEKLEFLAQDTGAKSENYMNKELSNEIVTGTFGRMKQVAEFLPP